ncbi:MAG: amino acid-binding protein [Butyrivibrio sp.]|nr:amino acid-binding protein [Butyrivibrio sp.]
MMKQLSIFAENTKGQFKAITTILKEYNINILGSVTNDSAEYGIIRMVVSDPELAVEKLSANGYICKTTKVLGIELTDEVGTLNNLLEALFSSNINVNYLYLSFNRDSGNPIMVLHTDDTYQVENILTAKGFVSV